MKRDDPATQGPEYTVGRSTDAGIAPPAASGTGAPEAPPGTGPHLSGARPAARGPRKVAVIAAHGMGQQVPFQTIDAVAEGLRLHSGLQSRFEAGAVKQGEKWLTRARLHFTGDGGDAADVDVYETYWAPLTEGRITIRDVIRFLAGAGLNGMRNGGGIFSRLVNGEARTFQPPARVVLYLAAALIVLASLVLLNVVIALVAAGRSFFGKEPAWLTDALFRDLTTTFNGVVVALAAFGACLGLSVVLRQWWLRGGAKAGARYALVQGSGWLSAAAMLLAMGVVALAAVSIVLLFLGHMSAPAPGGQDLWQRVFGTERIRAFNAGFDACAWFVLAVAAVVLLAWVAWKLVRGVARDMADARHGWLTGVAALFLAAVIVAAWWLWTRMAPLPATGDPGLAGVVASGLSWPLLVVASARIRSLLVQYMGDVAIYVSPYKLDRYYELRDDIRKRALDIARAVYDMRLEDGSRYERIVVMGHSLGSVVAYDVLNRLMMEDEARPDTPPAGSPGKMDVVERTPLLLTYGSPLDKTAFIFGVQGKDTRGLEALATSVQPLIRGYGFRPDAWINIHSPWDVISGPLDFYDEPGSRDSRCVRNVKDELATTLVVAHVQYTDNPLLYRYILDALGVRAAAVAG